MKEREARFELLNRLEKKNTAWIGDILREFTESKNLVVDARPRIFSVAKICVLLPKQSRFIGCEVDPSCMTQAMSQLTLLNARQMLSKE